jgi:hypothetical protein
VGAVIPIIATMSETVLAGSAIEVTLDTGAVVQLTAANNGNTLTGSYTVGIGENSADLTVSVITDISVTDLAGNPLGNTVVPTGVNNIGGLRAIVIDTVSPTVTITSSASTLRIGETATITFTLSEASSTFTEADVTATGGTLSGFTGSGSVYNAIFTPTAGFTGSGTVAVAAGVFTDAAGNGNTAGALSPVIGIDAAAPAVAIATSAASLRIGQTATITFTLSERSTSFTAEDVTASGGVLSSFSGSGTVYSAVFTPSTASTTSGAISIAAGTFTDAAGNANTAGALATPITIDTVAPTVVSIAASPAGTVRIGDVVTLTATISEDVQAGSSVNVTLDTGDVVTLFAGGAGTTLRGSFTVQAGQSSNALRVTAVNLTSAGVRDIAGNSLVSTAVPVQIQSPTVVVDAAVKTSTPVGFSSNAALIADRRTAVTSIPISFNTPVTGFSLASIRLLLNGRSVSLRGARLTGSGANYTLTIPSRLTNARGIYTLQISAATISAAANGAAMAEDQAYYWGKGRSVGFAAVAAAARPVPKAAARIMSIRR